MKKHSLLIAASALILAALACGRLTPAPPTAIPLTAASTAALPTKALPTSPPSGTMELTLKNDSGITICSVYISYTESDSWGENWLAENEAVRSGSSRSFQVPEGSYDLRADDCEGNLVAYQMEVDLAGRMTWTLDPLQRAPVLVVNRSSREICYLYISPSDSETWGPDWMGKDTTIPAGSTRTFQVPLGTYDLRVDDCDHNPMSTQSGVNVGANGITWTLEDVEAASLTLVNQLDIPICYVLISPSDSTEWGNDWLGGETVPPGGSYTFRLPAGTYNLSARDCDGHPVSDEVYGQEITGEMTWTISP
ncbi:MAG: hypothetical protein RML46_09120 [Anaerolineae bacterium]|nr:hypothetical protein [Anaerolineae bacterium]MDW8069060.1 hypothetical protein [Anaerolineae bacterium]